MRGSALREMAASYSARIVAAAEFENRIHIYDVESEEERCEFDTGYDFGGERLAVSDDGRFCAAGAYTRYGISMHDASNGGLLWRRKDLKKVQRLRFSRHRKDALFAHIDERSTHVLDVTSGETIDKLRGIEGMVESPFGDFEYVRERGYGFRLVNCGTNKRIGRDSAKFLLDACFTRKNLILIRTGDAGYVPDYDEDLGKRLPHYVACYGLDDFKELWRVEDDTLESQAPWAGRVRFSLFQDLSFCSDINRILCVWWLADPKDLMKRELLWINPNDGKIERKSTLEGCPHALTFLDRDRLLMSCTGEVIDVRNNEPICRFSVPTREYAD